MSPASMRRLGLALSFVVWLICMARVVSLALEVCR